MTNPERRPRLGVCLALAAATLAWFRSALWGRDLLYFRDLIQNLYPWRRFWAAEAAQGAWPLWDPYAASGTPFLANPNNLSLYPPSWLQAVLPFDLAFNAALAIAWIGAQAGMYRLARALDAGRGPALLAALAWGGCGYMVSALNLPNLLVAASGAPWAAWAALRVGRRGGARDIAALAAALALSAVGGEPLTLAVALAAALALGMWPRGDAAPPSLRARRLLAALGISTLLVAPLLLPALELARLSERGRGLPDEERGRWALVALDALALALPRVGGDPTSFDPARAWSLAPQGGAMPLFVSFYAGVPLLGLAALGWAGLPGRARAATAAGIALALGLAAGPALPLSASLQALGAAGSWVRYPVKFTIGAFGPLCLLAGLGLERLRRGDKPGKWAIGIPALFGLLVAAIVAGDLAGAGWIAPWAARRFGLGPEAAGAAARGLRASLAAALALGVAASALLGPLRRFLRPLQATIAWVVLVAADLAFAQATLVPRVSSERLRLRTIFPEHLRSGERVYREERPEGFRLYAPGPSRLWGFLWDRETLARGAASEAGIVNVLERPTDRMWPASTARLREWAVQAPPRERLHLLRRLGARWWLTYASEPLPGAEEKAVARGRSLPPLRLLRVDGALPPVFWTADCAVAAGEAELRRGLLSAGGPEVWVEAGPRAPPVCAGRPAAPASPAPAAAAGPGGGGECQVVGRSADHMELRCEAEAPGLAVVLDAWYPGWEVRVNGARLEPVRVNGAYRGVALPPGRHAVVWRFRPLSVQAGRLLGLVGFALLVILASKRPGRETKSVSHA